VTREDPDIEKSEFSLEMQRRENRRRIISEISVKFIAFARNLAVKEGLKIHPSPPDGVSYYFEIKIFQEGFQREQKVKELAFGLAALLRDSPDGRKNDPEIAEEAKSLMKEAEQFFDENAALFAEMVLEGEA